MMKNYISYIGLFTCLYLTPIQSKIWNGPKTPRWLCSIADNFKFSQLPNSAVSEMIVPDSAYYDYGHFFVIVYFALLVLFIGKTLEITKRLRAIVISVLIIGFCANIYIYWISECFLRYKNEVFQ